MAGRESRLNERGRLISRRSWLIGAAAGCAGGWARAEKSDDAAEADEKARREVEAAGAKAGLRPLLMSRSAHYLGIGDASDVFRSVTLGDCEAVRGEYIAHYQAKGFTLADPGERLVVVTLADDRSFAALLGKREYALIPQKEQGPAVHGVYSGATNWLIVYDHRSLGPQLAPRAGAENLRTLAHEATHQLTFNTGVLDRKGDVPACIREGLAMYGETPSPGGRTVPGAINHMRLRDLATTQRRRLAWIPAGTLLGDDRPLDGEAGEYGRLLAYAESWLLVHYLMTDDENLFEFRRYLKTIRGRETAERRLEDARAHLGDLDRLDQRLRQYAVKLQKM